MPTLTNLDIIDRALRKLNVNPQGVTATAEQGAECLAEMNTMITKWEEDDVFLQWFNQASVSDNFPLQDYCQQGVIGMLAIRVAPNYSVEVSQETLDYAQDGWATILRKAMNKQLPRSNLSHLPAGSARRWERITEG